MVAIFSRGEGLTHWIYALPGQVINVKVVTRRQFGPKPLPIATRYRVWTSANTLPIGRVETNLKMPSKICSKKFRPGFNTFSDRARHICIPTSTKIVIEFLGGVLGICKTRCDVSKRNELNWCPCRQPERKAVMWMGVKVQLDKYTWHEDILQFY